MKTVCVYVPPSHWEEGGYTSVVMRMCKATSKAPDLAVLGLNGSGERTAGFGRDADVLLQECSSVSELCTGLLA